MMFVVQSTSIAKMIILSLNIYFLVSMFQQFAPVAFKFVSLKLLSVLLNTHPLDSTRFVDKDSN